MIRPLLLAVLFAAVLSGTALAQSPYNYAAGQVPVNGNHAWQVGLAAVPTGLTPITGTTTAGSPAVLLASLDCSTKGTAGTITLQDAASGSPFLSAVAIAANTTYTIPWSTAASLGVTAAGGLAWQATGGPVYCVVLGSY